MPLHCFKSKKTFSTIWRCLYSSLSYSRCSLRFFFGGMHILMPYLRANSMIALVSSNCSTAVRMNLYTRSINYKPFIFIVIISKKDFKNAFPHAPLYPSAKSLCNRVPITKIRRRISPRCACAQNPKNSINKSPAVIRWSAAFALCVLVIVVRVCPTVYQTYHTFCVLAYRF